MEAILNRIKHWPSTLEGFAWSGWIVAGWGWLIEKMHCDPSQLEAAISPLTTELGLPGWLAAAAVIIRGALAKGPTIKQVAVKVVDAPQVPE